MLHKIHHVIRNLPTIWYMSVSCICIGHADLSPLSHTTYMSPHLGLVNSHYNNAALLECTRAKTALDGTNPMRHCQV